MCKSGGSSGPQSVTQTTVPTWAKPYAETALASTNKLIYNIGPDNEVLGMKPPPQYGGLGADTNRVASWSPMEIDAATRMQQQSTRMGAAEEMLPIYAGARGYLEEFGKKATAAGQYAPNLNFQANYNPGLFEQGSMTDPGVMQKYMSPYMQAVVDINKREATRDAYKQNLVNQAQAAQAGAFGGGRDAMVRAEAQRNLGMRLGDIQATGQQQAWEQGLGQYNTEANRLFMAQQEREKAKQFLTTADFEAQKAREQSRQFGATQGLAGLSKALEAATQYGTLTQQEAEQRMQYGQQQYEQETGLANKLAEYGGIERSAGQQAIDNAYQDFINAQNYPYRQLGFASDMLHGLPSGGTALYEAAPSVLSQAIGLGSAGLAGMGLYNANKR